MALTKEEKGELAKRIARGVQVVCSSIAQLHLGSPDPGVLPGEDETGIVASLREHGAHKWKFTNIEGALLLTKDAEGVLHFRIYDLNQYKLRFQYELYEEIDYKKLSGQVHAFEMENCMCGFSFSSPQVAEKFFTRVQSFKPKRTAPVRQQQAPNNIPVFRQANNAQGMSSGFNNSVKKKSVPRLPARNNKKANTGRSKRSTRTNGTPKKGDVFLGNGMLDPNNVPKEWKILLRQAGIKKRDLKNPEMFQIIKDVLTSHNIDLEPPEELDFTDTRLQEYYTPDQIAEWKEYQRQMKQYKDDQARYERELAEYNRQQEKQAKLQAMLRQQEQQKPAGNSGMTAKQRLRQSVAQNHGQQYANLRHLIPAGGGQAPNMQAPRMSVARPMVPALPVIPKEERIAQMVNSRASRVIMKTSMLEGLKGDIKLKRVSALPTIKNKSAGEQNSIMETLRAKLAQHRGAITNDDEDEGNDSGSEWDED